MLPTSHHIFSTFASLNISPGLLASHHFMGILLYVLLCHLQKKRLSFSFAGSHLNSSWSFVLTGPASLFQILIAILKEKSFV